VGNQKLKSIDLSATNSRLRHTHTQQVGDQELTSIDVSATNSRLIAVGDIKGTTTLVQVSQSLSELADKEKPRTSAMFDREYAQENILGKVGAQDTPYTTSFPKEKSRSVHTIIKLNDFLAFAPTGGEGGKWNNQMSNLELSTQL